MVLVSGLSYQVIIHLLIGYNPNVYFYIAFIGIIILISPYSFLPHQNGSGNIIYTNDI